MIKIIGPKEIIDNTILENLPCPDSCNCTNTTCIEAQKQSGLYEIIYTDMPNDGESEEHF